MNQPPDGPGADAASSMEQFLSGAYRRILWMAGGLTVAGAVIATAIAGWPSGLGLATGAGVACLNFVWLYHGAAIVVQRMIDAQRIEPAKHAPSKLPLLLGFTARYAFVLVAAYVILKSYPQVRVAFIVGLACPVIAAMGEGFYEAARPHPTSNS
jgi:ATP synthase I chain